MLHATRGHRFFFDTSALVDISCRRSRSSAEKDMSLVRTTDKLYNAVKRVDSGHELGEVEEVAAGCS